MSDQEEVVYTLEVHVPGTPRGGVVAIQGLGEFKNGSANEITREQAERFRSLNEVRELVTDNDGNPVIEGDSYVFKTVNGPTLLQWARGSELFTVSTFDPDEEEDEEEEEFDEDEDEVDESTDGGDN